MYWYAGQIKSGGAIVFSRDKKFTDDDVPALSRRYTWLSTSYGSLRGASLGLMKQATMKRNPPATMTVVHKGTIDVKHHSDPKLLKYRSRAAVKSKSRTTTKKKNPPRSWHEQELRLLNAEAALWSDLGVKKDELQKLRGAIEQEMKALKAHDDKADSISRNPKRKSGTSLKSLKTKAGWLRKVAKYFPKASVTKDRKDAHVWIAEHKGKSVGSWNNNTKSGQVMTIHKDGVLVNTPGKRKNPVRQTLKLTISAWKKSAKKHYKHVEFVSIPGPDTAIAAIINAHTIVGEWENGQGWLTKKNPVRQWEHPSGHVTKDNPGSYYVAATMHHKDIKGIQKERLGPFVSKLDAKKGARTVTKLFQQLGFTRVTTSVVT